MTLLLALVACALWTVFLAVVLELAAYCDGGQTFVGMVRARIDEVIA